MKQKRVWLMSGAPGCGKSTWINKQIEKNGGVHISRDVVRFNMVKDDEEYFSHETAVFNEFARQANAAIENENGPDDIYIDATHLNQASRNKILKKLVLDNVTVNVVFMRPAIETCIERNEKREGRSVVPRSALRRMWYQQTDPATDEFASHYNQIIYVEE